MTPILSILIIVCRLAKDNTALFKGVILTSHSVVRLLSGKQSKRYIVLTVNTSNQPNERPLTPLCLIKHSLIIKSYPIKLISHL